MTNEKHKAIFKGIVNERFWHVADNVIDLKSLNHKLEIAQRYPHHFNSIEIDEIHKSLRDFKREVSIVEGSRFLKHEDIWIGDISRPVLEVGEEIYINDLDMLVVVSKKYRTTNDEVIYETKRNIRTIKTNSTEETRLLAVEIWFKDLYSKFEKFEELKSEFMEEEKPLERFKPSEMAKELDEQSESWKPSWEKKEKKEKSWFDWLKK